MAAQPKDSDPFHTTCWSVVVAAGRKSSPDSKQALASLCETYWLPIYAYVRRRAGNAEAAQDLTQAFFAELLEKNVVGEADASRGRFRAFLLTACRNFLSKQRERDRAQKRGGGRGPISLDFESADSQFSIDPAAQQLTPDQVYEQQWALALLARIMRRLADQLGAAGKAEQFETLKGFLVGDHEALSYADAAGRLGMNEAATRKAVSRLRARYRQLLREEIARTVAEPEEVDEEIRNLFSVFGESS